MPLTSTPLLYPGGKSQLRPLIRKMLNQGATMPAAYCEPFCGGAGIAVDLLIKGDVNSIYLNDADAGIYSFWRAIVEETERFIKETEAVKVDYDTWIRFKDTRSELYKTYARGGYSFELGFITFFLNRTNRSGIIDGGCIGGKTQSSKYKIDCRFNKKSLIEKIGKIGDLSSKVSVSNADGAVYLRKDLPNLLHRAGLQPDDALVYLDPPYVKKGESLYLNSMDEDSHADLSEAVLYGVFDNWLLTYDDVPLIRDLYKECDLREIGVRYSANKKEMAGEVAIFSPRYKDLEV